MEITNLTLKVVTDTKALEQLKDETEKAGDDIEKVAEKSRSTFEQFNGEIDTTNKKLQELTTKGAGNRDEFETFGLDQEKTISTFSEFIDNLIEKAEELSIIGPIIGISFAEVTEVLEIAFGALDDVLLGFFKNRELIQHTRTTLEVTRVFAENYIKTIRNIFEKQGVGGVFKRLGSDIKDLVSINYYNFKDFLRSLKEGGKAQYDNIVNFLGRAKEFGSRGFDRLKEFAGTVRDFSKAGVDRVRDFFKAIGEGARAEWGKLIQGLRSLKEAGKIKLDQLANVDFSKITESIRKFGAILANNKVTKSVAEFVSKTKNISIGLSTLLHGLRLLATSPIGKFTLVGASLSGIAAGVLTIIDNWEAIKLNSEIVWEEEIVPILESSVNKIGTALGKIGSGAETVFNKLKGINFKGLIPFIGPEEQHRGFETIKKIAEENSTSFTTSMDLVGASTEDVEENIEELNEDMLKYLRLIEQYIDLTLEANKSTQDFAILGLNLSRKELEKLRERIRELLNDEIPGGGVIDIEVNTDVAEKINEDTSQAKNSLNEFGVYAANVVANISQNFGDLIFETLKGNFDSLSDFWDATMDSILKSFSDLVAAIASKPIIYLLQPKVQGGGAGAQGGGGAKGLAGLFDIGQGFKTIGSGLKAVKMDYSDEIVDITWEEMWGPQANVVYERQGGDKLGSWGLGNVDEVNEVYDGKRLESMDKAMDESMGIGCG